MQFSFESFSIESFVAECKLFEIISGLKLNLENSKIILT